MLSREIARLVLIFRLEEDDWKIVHSGISIPYHLVQNGEIYPLKGLQDRNSDLESLVEQRTKELKESEARYRLLTEETLDVIWKTDRNLCITYISPADERLRGFKAEEVLGQHVFDLFTDDGVATVKNILKNRPQTNEGKESPEGFLTFAVPPRSKSGECCGVRCLPSLNLMRKARSWVTTAPRASAPIRSGWNTKSGNWLFLTH